MAMHLGVKVLPGKYGLKLSREKYAIINKRNSLSKFKNMIYAYEDEEGKIYTDKWCLKHQKNCLENFDLHMELFANLSNDEFNSEIDRFLIKYSVFKELKNLNNVNRVPGYYMMILDEYKQVYIGTSRNIYKRIRQHWTKNKSFDRLLFPMAAVNKSIMSIDSFRALDTTRLFVYETSEIFSSEDEFISFFSPGFCTNRMSGGHIEGGLLNTISMLKSRNLK